MMSPLLSFNCLILFAGRLSALLGLALANEQLVVGTEAMQARRYEAAVSAFKAGLVQQTKYCVGRPSEDRQAANASSTAMDQLMVARQQLQATLAASNARAARAEGDDGGEG